jgi:diguanylate cyclase (GGDEF)-like protein/PAS domain S-box-containing protein
LKSSRDEFDEMVRCSRDIHLVTDCNGLVLQCNPAASAVAPAQRLAGENLAAWVLPGYIDLYNQLRANSTFGRSGAQEECELHLRHSANDSFPLIVAASAFRIYRDGEVHGLHWILRNITYLREAEIDTKVATMVFESAAEGVMITDIDGEIVAVNPAFTQITGYAANEVIGRKASLLRSGVHDSAFYAEFWRTLRESGKWQGEIYNRRKSGEMYTAWQTISAAGDNCGHVLSYVSVFSDISRLLRAEKRLAYLAHYDTLTGLPNRHLFHDRLHQAIANARRGETLFTLIFIDLDRFKAINDQLGHHAGDRVLHEAGRRLSSAVREIDTVARLGGDEFVIIAPGLGGSEDIGRFCRHVIELLIQPIDLDGSLVGIGGSLGCAEYPCHGEDEEALLKCADKAMYQAKLAGGDIHILFEAGIPLANEAP